MGKIRPNEDGSLPTVSWLKDGLPLTADNNVKSITLPDGTVGLQFMDAAPSDTANYTAILRNPGTDEEDQSSALVNVSRKLSLALPKLRWTQMKFQIFNVISARDPT